MCEMFYADTARGSMVLAKQVQVPSSIEIGKLRSLRTVTSSRRCKTRRITWPSSTVFALLALNHDAASSSAAGAEK